MNQDECNMLSEKPEKSEGSQDQPAAATKDRDSYISKMRLEFGGRLG